jgi:hypothetical protein
MTTSSKEALTSAPAATKGKLERTHSVIQTVSMTCGIIGAVGAAGVWALANFYVGDVEIAPSKPVQALIVKVYDKKGQEATFHFNRFQLMPGSYHLEITADNSKPQHTDVEIQFGHKLTVPVTVASEAPGSGQELATEEPDQTQKHHWWQFWRK